MKNDDFGFGVSKELEILQNAVPGFEAICRRWSMIALGALGGSQAMLRTQNCNNVSLLDALGLQYQNGEGYYEKTVAEQSIKTAYDAAIENDPTWPEQSPLIENIHWMTRVLGLNRTEVALLTLVILERQDTILSQALDSLGALNNSRLYDMLCHLLHVTEVDIRAALSPKSQLYRSGLLRLDGRIYSFEHKIDLINGLAEKMIISHEAPFSLFSNSFVGGHLAKLKVLDYPHLEEDLRNIKNFLVDSLNTGTHGVNILVYGPPGTGKTELTRLLSKELKASLFEIATETEEGNRLTHSDRINSYQLSQHVLAHAPRSLLLFDEVEDVFSAPPMAHFHSEQHGLRGNISGQKAWLNKLLEENRVPTFWLTNNISDIDPAHLRRFSYHLCVKVPPRSVRERIIQAYTKTLGLSSDCIRQIASHEGLPPAIVASSSSVAQAILHSDSKANMEKVMNRLISNSLRALGDLPHNEESSDSRLPYDPSVLNTHCDLGNLINGVKKTGSARLCLYGPPGTGKTAFAHYMADQLDRMLLVRRASDILGSFVGQTERNIAAAFEEARDENAILLIDEADSFLRDREGAIRSWEVTSVNEMLTNMESFQGIFIASTNMLDQMDAASLRRFDGKILFDFLKPTQALILFRKACEHNSLKSDDQAEQKILRLSILTPGDFTSVMRQSRLVGFETASDLAEKLKQECALKPQGKQNKIGF
jgi:transitional endoplasmic reticulum ATPase